MTDAPTPAGERPEAVAGLVPRLALIDDQPLEHRAAAYAELHDELRAVLEGQGQQGQGEQGQGQQGHGAGPARPGLPGRR